VLLLFWRIRDHHYLVHETEIVHHERSVGAIRSLQRPKVDPAMLAKMATVDRAGGTSSDSAIERMAL
jgi:hypothetical protein